jgi:hypothetical protein
MAPKQCFRSVFLLAFVFAESAFGSYLCSTSVTEEERSKAILQLEKYWSSLESVYTGIFDFRINWTSVKNKSPRDSLEGKILFDLIRDNHCFSNFNDPIRPSFFSRSDGKIFTYLDDGGRGRVNIHGIGSKAIISDGFPPIDFRQIPTLSLDELRNLDIYNSLKTRMSKTLEITKVREVPGLLEITLETKMRPLREFVEATESPHREQLMLLLESGQPLPLSKTRHVLYFDVNRMGVLLEFTTELSPIDLNQWVNTVRTTTKWISMNGVDLPFQCDSSCRNAKATIELNWVEVNQEMNERLFNPDSFDELKGFEIIDCRFPEPLTVGVVGSIPLSVVTGQKTTSWLFYGFGLLSVCLVLVFIRRMKDRK